MNSGMMVISPMLDRASHASGFLRSDQCRYNVSILGFGLRSLASKMPRLRFRRLSALADRLNYNFLLSTVGSTRINSTPPLAMD